ncbi:MAG: GNAT family N-acetyltransferase [Psychrosphaera sp.]|nr:GNAT family N-acetyltransferase [Psychrosphaera sp.]
MTINIEPVTKAHNRKQFDCGEPALNRFIGSTARQHNDKELSKTYVLVDDAMPDIILGFYTLIVCEMKVPKKVVNYPNPVGALKLARLAVDRAAQGTGFGKLLLIDAIHKLLRVSDIVGTIGLFVDAKNNNVRDFYLPFGFEVIWENDECLLFLPTARCRKYFLQ